MTPEKAAKLEQIKALAAKAPYMDIPLVQPLPKGVAAKDNEIVLVCRKFNVDDEREEEVRFPIPRNAATFYCRMMAGMLEDTTDTEVPIGANESATPDIVAIFATWATYHAKHARSKQPSPMPVLWSIDMYFKKQPWDINLIRQEYFIGQREDLTEPIVAWNGDTQYPLYWGDKENPKMYTAKLTRYDRLIKAMNLCSFLQCEAFADMLCTYLCWHIKHAAILDDPFEKSAKIIGLEYIPKEFLTFCMGKLSETLDGANPGERRSMLSEDEYDDMAGLAAGVLRVKGEKRAEGWNGAALTPYEE